MRPLFDSPRHAHTLLLCRFASSSEPMVIAVCHPATAILAATQPCALMEVEDAVGRW